MKKKSTDRSGKAPRKTKATGERNSSGSPTVFPIVGIGASAGGLEAFTQLLGALPLDTGMGFVLVQHLDPDHESQLTQILARATSLPIHEITNDEPVQPNHVYVIPRDTSLSIADGLLKVLPRPRGRAPHRPIDSFFESLAQDRRELAVGVVMSGTGSDGTLGLEAIKAEGGINFAQDASAKHDSMPRSAVAAGVVDLVLSPSQIAKELARIAKHPAVGRLEPGVPEQGDTTPEEDRAFATKHEDDYTPLPSGGKGTPRSGAKQARAEAESSDESNGKPAQNGYKKILLLLRNHSGVDFSLYKSTTIQRRINRRLLLSKVNNLEEYAAMLRDSAKELDALYSDVLISVTSFFRNPETFDVLQKEILPEMLRKPGDNPLRCWVLGCSTGQEAYSIAMAFAEEAEKAPRARTLQIFATDLNETLLDKARHGLYARSLAEDIAPQRLRRFFVEEEGGYRVTKSLREMVVFARQNLVADPPFSRMDLISCRNLLIYLEPSLQKRALPTFHYALKSGGFLLLGASESIGGFTDLFEPVDKKHKIYSKKLAPASAPHLPLRKEPDGEPPSARRFLPLQAAPSATLPESLRGELDAQREADRITVNQFAPPGVLVNAELQILQFRGPTGAFLEPPVGKASFNVLKMAREGLMLPLRSAINEAKKDNKTARREKVEVTRSGKTRAVNLEVIPLRNLSERCFLILFEDAQKQGAEGTAEPKPAPKERAPSREQRSRVAALETELSEMREFVQSVQEQHEAANEEVQSANEEVQSANEELQSVNEELETSKEELESANEELTTVNDEMSNRNVELNRLNNDLTNLQTSTKLAILLLGRDLGIRRFSPQAAKQLDLLVSDVGRPISHIRHGLIEVEDGAVVTRPGHDGGSEPMGPPLDLEHLVAGVIADVREQEREVVDKHNRWQSLRVRPYLTVDGKVDGAVVVLMDIDALKRTERTAAHLAAIVTSSDDAIVSKDLQGIIQFWNKGAEHLFGYTAKEVIGKPVTILIPADHADEEPQILNRIGRGESVEHYETVRQRKDGSQFDISLTVSPVRDAGGRIIGAAKIARDITERKQMQEDLRASEVLQRSVVEQVKDYAIFRTDPQGLAVTWNEGVKRLLGFDEADFLGRDITQAIFTPEDIQNGIPQWELDTAANTGTASNDRWMRRKSGERFFANGVTTSVKDESGNLLGFTKVMRDGTAQTQAEEALRQSEAQLAADATALTRLNDLSSRLWQVRNLDEGLEEMLGILIDLTGADMGNIQLLDEQRGVLLIRVQRGFERDFLDFFREVSIEDDSASGRALRSGERIIVEDIETDGPYAPLRSVARAAGYRAVQSTPLRGRHGAPLGMISTHFRSVHRPSEQELRLLDLYTHQAASFIERCRADEILEQSNTRLEAATGELMDKQERLLQYSAELSEADGRKNEFLAMLGHELRNPLSALAHGVELLGMGPATDDGRRSEELLGMMSRQTGRISALLDQLLEMSRVSSGKVDLSKDRIDLAGVVRVAVETLQANFEASKHELTLTLPPEGSVRVTGDAIRLTQALENLLVNAIKYTDEGGLIALSLEADEGEARITVRDNGIGMSAELLPHVFELFTQAPRSLDRAKGGLGLGLPLVKRLVEMHGGRVTATSPGVGEGSEFVMTLPRLRDDGSDGRSDDGNQPPRPGPVEIRRILVVDDEKETAESLAELLGDDGHDTLAVHDGPSALQAVRSFAPDVVLLDLGLPEMDGYAVARRLRDEHGDRITLIAVTGYQNDAARLKQAGFDEHMIKPPDMRKLSVLLAASDGGGRGVR